MIAATFGSGEPIVIQRTTGSYHGYMAILLFAGYLGLIVWKFGTPRKGPPYRYPMAPRHRHTGAIRLGGGGCCWRHPQRGGFENFSDKILTLVTNSLLETNLGMPYIYFIFLAWSSRFTEQLKRRRQKLPLLARLAENNAERVRGEDLSEYLGGPSAEHDRPAP